MGGGLPPIPSYTIYKVENVPQMKLVQDRLAKRGLKDPWLRNECWRYHPGFGTVASRAKLFWTRGLIPGLVIGYLTYLANQQYLKWNPDFYHWSDPDFPEKGNYYGTGHGHGHGDEHGHGEAAHGHH
ncbi:hypothetical protein BV898_04098 [Hypsibius exemplaris]|uniref:NADH dehydrogenase [ubiquinone] 1 beta subcomplex subunit 3 n=1 Tax=Hypsibius exemplaris TaxID=2072580 RepID=A0A1W0X323_HYPEX|nr:hypothetical protein BV898_04098 [Hypsibius exemplaris]